MAPLDSASDLGLAMLCSLGEFCCGAAFDCRPMTAVDFAKVLQALSPSYHVWSSLALPALPQFPNQEPLRPQQLLFPDFAMMPHLEHKELSLAAVTAGVFMRALVYIQRKAI